MTLLRYSSIYYCLYNFFKRIFYFQNHISFRGNKVTVGI